MKRALWPITATVLTAAMATCAAPVALSESALEPAASRDGLSGHKRAGKAR